MELTVEFVCCNGGELMSQSFSVRRGSYTLMTGFMSFSRENKL